MEMLITCHVCQEPAQRLSELLIKKPPKQYSGVSVQQTASIELLCVNSCAVQYYEQNVFPVDVERASSVWRDLLQEHQVLQQVVALFETGVKPKSSSTHSEVRSYLRHWDMLTMLDDVLHRRLINPDTGATLQLVLPSSERRQSVTGLNDDIAHHKRDRTLWLVQARIFWPRMAGGDITT